MGDLGILVVLLVAASAGFVALFLLICVPPMLIARRIDEPGTIRRFTVASAIAGVFLGVVVGTSRRLTDQCVAEGNTQCFDAGATGLIYLVIFGFVVVSATRTWQLLHY